MCNVSNLWKISSKKIFKRINKNQLELSKEDIERDEIVYERDNLKFYGAEAFIQSTYDLGGFYKVIFALKIFPKIFRDLIYKYISKNRQRIFKSN